MAGGLPYESQNNKKPEEKKQNIFSKSIYTQSTANTSSNVFSFSLKMQHITEREGVKGGGGIRN